MPTPNYHLRPTIDNDEQTEEKIAFYRAVSKIRPGVELSEDCPVAFPEKAKEKQNAKVRWEDWAYWPIAWKTYSDIERWGCTNYITTASIMCKILYWVYTCLTEEEREIMHMILAVVM